MRRRPVEVLMSLMFLSLAGCASTGAYAPSTLESRADGRADVMTAADIEGTRASNLYEAIEQARPLFFNTRGMAAGRNGLYGPFLVILNGNVIGGLSELRTISPMNVRTIRRLSASEVYFRTGRPAPGGGIEVTIVR